MTTAAVPLSHNEILDRIRAVETSVLGQDLLNDPVFAEYYPLIRQRAIVDNFAQIKGIAGQNSRLAKLRSLFEIVRHEGIWRKPVPKGPTDLVMLSYTTSRLFQVAGGWVDAYAEPFLAAIEEQGGKHAVLEVPGKGEYRSPATRKTSLLGQDELYARVKSRFRKRTPPIQQEVAAYAALCQDQGLTVTGLTSTDWSRLWNYFVCRRDLFAKQLARLTPDMAIVITWYGTTGMAFTSAAKQMGVPTADLQHGVQGPAHWMYSNWPVQTVDSTILPSAFFN